MTKTFNFYTKNNSNNSNKKNIFLGNTDYSSILDNIITADIIKKNSYLFNHSTSEDILDDLFDDDPIILTGSKLKVNDDFIKAANFLANYKKYKKTYKIPYILGKMYMLSDGTPIVFYDDEIQIGFDTFKYSKFGDLTFLKNLSAPTKKIIVNIYTYGKSDININIL